MIEFAQIPLLHLAVDIITIRVITASQVFFQRDLYSCHTEIPDSRILLSIAQTGNAYCATVESTVGIPTVPDTEDIDRILATVVKENPVITTPESKRQ